MMLDPKPGDLAYNLSSGGLTIFFRRLRVVRVTATQVTAIDQMGRHTTYWRKNGFEIGNRINCLTLQDPPAWAKEPKQLIGKPLPEVPADG